MARLLGIDIGTSGCRALVIDERGNVVAEATASYSVYAPHPTWSEQNPEDWWDATVRCLNAIGAIDAINAIGALSSSSSSSPLSPSSHLAAIGLTGQMHGAVFLDEDGEVIRPAILWNDQRTTEECEDIDRIVGRDRVREITLNPPLTGFQLPKILWLRKHEAKNFARVRKVLLPKDYIRFRLTGEYVSEVSDASGTGIFDIRRRAWSEEMMDALGLSTDLFPRVVESCANTGFALPGVGIARRGAEYRRDAEDVSRKDAKDRKGAPGLEANAQRSELKNPPSPTPAPFAAQTSAERGRGFIPNANIPVFGGGGDQAAGAVGTGAVVPGIVSISLGTSGVVFTSLDSIQDSGSKIQDSGSKMQDSGSKIQVEIHDPSEPPTPSAPSSRKGQGLEAFHTFCHSNGAWHAMGVMLSCGGALSWYASNVRHLSVADVLEEAEMAEPGCGRLTFLPYLSGERSPVNDPFARGAFVGFDLSHGSKEMSRAVVEGATFGLRQCWEAIPSISDRGSRIADLRRLGKGGVHGVEQEGRGDSQIRDPRSEIRVRVTGGGARSDFWVQMIADVFGVPCETLETDQGPAFGAALIAGVGSGVWPSLEEACRSCIRVGKSFLPSGTDYAESYRRYCELYPHLKGWFCGKT